MAAAGGRRNEMRPEAAGRQADPEVITARENSLWALIDCRDRAQGKPRPTDLYPLTPILRLLSGLMGKESKLMGDAQALKWWLKD